MIQIPKPLACALILAAAALGFAACSAPRDTSAAKLPAASDPVQTAAPAPTATPVPNAGITNLALTVATAEELEQAEEYPDLKTLDLSGSTIDTAEIVAWAKAHPGVAVTYDVYLGGEWFPTDATALTVPADVPYEEVATALEYLPEVTAISLPGTTLTGEQLEILSAAYALDYSVTLFGQTYGADTEELDLSGLQPAQVAEAAEGLRRLPALQYVELLDESGASALALDDVRELAAAAPAAALHYKFSLLGRTIDTTDGVYEFTGAVGNDGEAQIRAALDVLPAGSVLHLINSGLSNETLAAIRDDYPDKTLGWRLYLGRYAVMTDDQVFRLTNGLTDAICGDLKYCTEAMYVDVGHDDTLTDISWTAYMPKLKCIIVSGSIVEDISGLSSCDELEWLELVYCTRLSDLSPLEGLEGLKYLNISYTVVSDITPLEELSLERFNCIGTQVRWVDFNAYSTNHPDCLCVNTGNPYSYGWRYTDYGYHWNEEYTHMRQVFRYDDPNEYLVGAWTLASVDTDY